MSSGGGIGPRGTGAAGEAPAWRVIPENLPFGVVLFDLEQSILYRNREHAALLGFDMEESGGIEPWLRRGCRDAAYAEKVVASWREHIWQKQLTRAFSLKTEDERLREIEFRANLLEDGRLLLTLIDVTESRRSEDALRLTETKYHTVFENAGAGIGIIDRTGRFVEVNSRFAATLGYATHQMIRMSVGECVAPEDMGRLFEAEAMLRKNDGIGLQKVSIRFRDHESALARKTVSLLAIRDLEGNPQLTAYIIRENSPDGEPEAGAPAAADAARAAIRSGSPEHPAEAGDLEEDLRRSREQNRAFLETIPDLILLMSADGSVRDLVPPAADWPGLKLSDDWTGQNIWTVWPEFGDVALQLLGQALESGEVAGAEFTAESGPGGGEFTYRVRVAGCGDDQAVAVIADITSLKSDREARLRQGVAFRHLQEAIFVTTVEGRILEVNAAAERVFGYAEEDLRGRGLATLYAPDSAEEFNRNLSKQLTEFGRWETRTPFHRKGGQRGFGEVVFLPVEDDGLPNSLIGIQREISDETLDATLGDRMQHRLRNQLQQVSSLFSLELEASPDGTSPPDLPPGVNWLQKFQVRLRSVTRMPEFAEDYTGPARLAAYAQAVGDDVVRILGRPGSNGDVQVTGDETIEGGVEIATPFGLLVAELVFSALSHPEGPPLAGEPKVRLILEKKDGKALMVARAVSGAFATASVSVLKCLVNQLHGGLQVVNQGQYVDVQIHFPVTV